MASPPVLLVADDLSVIGAVKRVLAREGYECVLATNAADAIIAWHDGLPGLILLQPSVEGNRGAVVLEELAEHPNARLLRVVLLGETVPGCPWPVEPLPLDPDALAQTISDNFRSADATEGWKVLDTQTQTQAANPSPAVAEPEQWRITLPQPSSAAEDAGSADDDFDVPDPSAIVDETPSAESADEAPGAGPEPEPAPAQPIDRIFGDLPSIEEALHRDVEAEVRASVDSTLSAASAAAADDELQRLEDEVRAEAHRRREARQPTAPLPGPAAQTEAKPSPPQASRISRAASADDEAFADLADQRSAPVVRATQAPQLLARAEQLLLETRAVGESRHREDEVITRRLQAELEAATRRCEHADSLVRKERESRAAVEAQMARLEQTHRKELGETHHHFESMKAKTTALTAQVRGLSGALEQKSKALAQLEAELMEARAAQAAARESEIALQSETTNVQVILAQVARDRDTAEERLTAAMGDSLAVQEELRSKIEALATERETLSDTLAHTLSELKTFKDLPTAVAERDALVTQQQETMEELQVAVETLRKRLESAEADAQAAKQELKELKERPVVQLPISGAPAIGLSRSGEVTLEALALLMLELVGAQTDGRLELAVSLGKRTLWFKRGSIVAAESTLPQETLLHRARRDGLIDARQENELRMLAAATAPEQLDALKVRRLIREVEVVPLVQRFTEQLVLEALAEPASAYRLSQDSPGVQVLPEAATRSALLLLAEAIRRALPSDTLLERLGGSGAIPRLLGSALDLRELGFGERERKMLSWVDGEVTVEDLCLASSLTPDVAFRCLLVARLLGVLEMLPAKSAPPAIDPELDVRRLESKYDEVQDADYFTILGLPRSAGTEDVRRAFERLGSEFDPLRFSGHPDISVQQRAQVVFRQLEEATRALADERRRAEYARHLLD